MINYYAMVVVFIVGIVMISLEDRIRINKAAVAVLMCVAMWLMLISGSGDILLGLNNSSYSEYITLNGLEESMSNMGELTRYIAEKQFVPHLGSVSETLFFVMGTMIVINIVDKYGGFRAITDRVTTNDKRKLLWIISFLAFFLSACIDNIAAALVLIAILRKMVPDKTDRMKYACMIVISANAGGSWSPIGDVTTLLLWTGGYLTPLHQITHLFLSSLMNMLVPLVIAHFWLFKPNAKLREKHELPLDRAQTLVSQNERMTIFLVGFLSLALVPLFQFWTGLPPFLCVLLGLSLLWVYTDILNVDTRPYEEELRVTSILHELDLSTIFFFLGILMSIAALETGGQLHEASLFLDEKLHNPFLLSTIIGMISSFTDNVALVAGTMGMYPLPAETMAEVSGYAANFVQNGAFWTTTAYTAVTGGSLLIIGSATGVTVMGLEGISFGYYFKRFSILALAGYLSGLGCTYLMLQL